MKKKIVKVLSLALVAAMSFCLLAGCGGSDAGTDNTDANVSEDGVPTYKIAIVRWTDAWPTDFLKNGVMAQLEEEAGVNIEWQVYAYGDWMEQKSLLLASGDLPDAFFGSLALNASDLAQNKAAFVDLTDLIPANMPNLTKALESDGALKAVCTDRNGQIYSLPKKLPLRPEVCGNVGFINKKWLDNLGLEVPKTYKELEDVLVAFATQDADGDGDPNNEIPFTGFAQNTVMSNDTRNILSPFGTITSRQDNYMGMNKEGKPVFMPVQDNYKEAVKWMHELWEKGAIDPEYFTQEQSMSTSKKQADGGSQVGLVFGWTADAEVAANEGDFVVLEAVEGYDGGHYVEAASDNLDISALELEITTSCKNPEKLLQWADLFYTDEVSLQTYYGSIPDQLSKNDDGTYSLLIPEDGTSLDSSAWMNSFRDHGPKYMSKDFESKVILPTEQGDGVKLALDEVNAKYVTPGKNVGMPVLQYTDEELNRMATLTADIYKYVEAQYAHWVTEGGIDEEWDAYLEQLDAMGIQELIEIQNTAYEAYVANF